MDLFSDTGSTSNTTTLPMLNCTPTKTILHSPVSGLIINLNTARFILEGNTMFTAFPYDSISFLKTSAGLTSLGIDLSVGSSVDNR